MRPSSFRTLRLAEAHAGGRGSRRSSFVRAPDVEHAAFVVRLLGTRSGGRACRPKGSNVGHLRKTAASLEEHGLDDRELWDLHRPVAQEDDRLRENGECETPQG